VNLTALDTGFFVRLPVHVQGDGRAVDRWRALVEGEGEGVVSGLSLVDALVLATALEAGAEELWTTDAHLTAYEGRMRVVRL
jgi:predicted nucleic acid-binding protein